MTSEGWQTLSQFVIALGIVLTALGGLGAYVIGQRIEREKDVRSAYTGQLTAKTDVLLSAHEQVWPQVEFGDSGAIVMYAGPQGSPLFKFAEDTHLTVVREDGAVKVSTIIRDKSGAVVAELRKNEWKVNPSKSWDRNYTSEALEVKDPTGDIVLQVRALPDRVQLQAKLFDASGRGFAFGKVRGAEGWGGGIEVTGLGNPQLRMKIQPMFNYPSDSHFAELVKPGDG